MRLPPCAPLRLPPCTPPPRLPPVRNAEAMYRKPVGAILCQAGNNDDGLDGKCMVTRKGGGRNVRQNVGGLATVTIDYQGGCRGVWIKQAMFLLKEKVVQGILSNAVFFQKYHFFMVDFFVLTTVM